MVDNVVVKDGGNSAWIFLLIIVVTLFFFVFTNLGFVFLEGAGFSNAPVWNDRVDDVKDKILLREKVEETVERGRGGFGTLKEAINDPESFVDLDEEEEIESNRGLIVNFMESIPPQTLPPLERDFSIGLRVENFGEEEIKALVCAGDLLKEGDSKIGMLNKRIECEEGNITELNDRTFLFSDFKVVRDPSKDTTIPLFGAACYNEESIALTTACVKGVDEDCNDGRLSVSGQGLEPVVVTGVEQVSNVNEDSTEIQYLISLEKKGNGAILIKQDAFETCGVVKVDQDVKVTSSLEGLGSLTCDNEGIVSMRDGKGSVRCVKEVENVDTSFSLNLNIKIDYGYLSFTVNDFVIKKSENEVDS